MKRIAFLVLCAVLLLSYLPAAQAQEETPPNRKVYLPLVV